MDTDTTETLREKIEDITGLEQEEGESAEDYKARIVRHFADKYPNTDEGNAAFDELDDDVRDWVDEATEVVSKNRGARTKKAIPELDGLPEDAPKGKAKSGGKAGAKEKSTKKGTGRGFGEKKELAATFEAPDENAKVSKHLTAVFKKHGFSKQKDRSDDGFIVYKNGDTSKTIYVGPGKGEKAYLMGWRAESQKQHSYGAAALEQYLSGS